MQDRFRKFTLLFSEINRCINKIKTEEMARFDLKGAHVSCLYYLYMNEELTAKELCDICQEDKAAVSRSIDYLEKQGYLYCESKAQKRYKSPLKLTEKGVEAGRQVAEKITGVLNEATADISEWDLAAMYHSLYSISDKLQKICSTYNEQHTK